MTIKVLELIATSPKSFDDALKSGIKRAQKGIRGITGVDVVGQKVEVKDGKVVQYKVVMKVAFSLE